ncbi:hypothetical protein K8I28_10195 [bacterium]|nr:hypothetical protein [bacterium]
MAEHRVWIVADLHDSYGTLHFDRGVALAEAAMREEIEEITFISSKSNSSLFKGYNLDGVSFLGVESTTSETLANQLIDMLKAHIPSRVDSRHPRPHLYLCGDFDIQVQKAIWKAGIELTVVQDWAEETYADYHVLAGADGGEVDMKSHTGFTYFLRGSHYAPFRIHTMKYIQKHHPHATAASTFTIATENLDYTTWIPRIMQCVANIQKPKEYTYEWKPSVKILPGLNCPDAATLKKLAEGKGIDVEVIENRTYPADALYHTDILFSAENTTLHESLALGIPRVCLPLKSSKHDHLLDHLQRREASPRLPENLENFAQDFANDLSRSSFDAAYRRAQARIGQYLCDGMGSVRIIRQSVFKVYEVPQNMVRFFELGDPMIDKM